MKIKDFFAGILKNKTALIIIIGALAFIITLAVMLPPYLKKDAAPAADTTSETTAEITAGSTDTPDASDDTSADSGAQTDDVTTAAGETADSITAAPAARAVTAAPEPAETAHVHQYAARVTAPTCTAQGYTVHTCACGATYTDSYIGACHDFLKSYVCHRCGKPDPESPVPGLGLWVKNHGTETVKGTAYYVEYTFGDEGYSIYSSNTLSFDYYLEFYYGCGDKEISFSFDCTPGFSIRYKKGEYRVNEKGYYDTSYQSDGIVALNKSDISAGMNFLFDEYYPGKDESMTNEQYSAEAKELLLHAMQVFQDRILYPETDFTFRTLGFTNY